MAAFNFPNSPSVNDTYTANGVTFKWNGTIWQRTSASVGAQGGTGAQGSQGNQGTPAGLTIGTSAPGSPSAGDMWWDSDSGLFLTYYNDGNSSQWVELNQGPMGAQGAQGAQGHQGAAGAQGAQGHQGHQGSAGSNASISNNSQYRLITGGSGTNLAGNTYATWNGNNLALRGGEGENCTIELASDEGDDHADFWRMMAQASDNALAIDHYGSGSWAEKLRITSTGKVNIGDSQMSSNLLNIEDGTAAAIDIASHGTGGDTAYIGVKKSSGGGLTFGISNRDIIFKTGASYSSGTTFDSGTERFRIVSDGRFGFGTSSPSDYALATFDSNNGILLRGNTQTRILLRDSGGGTNEKMMDIMCDSGNIYFRTINDDYTTATQRAVIRADGNFAIGNRVGTNGVSTNQPVAFQSARVTPDTMTSTVSNGVRCNLYVGSNEGWAAGDGGVIGMGGSRSGSAGQEAIWSYIKGSRQSGNGWEYAGKMELGTTEWGTYNMTKAMTIFADNQVRLHGDDSTMMTFDIGGATRLVIEHTGGGNMRLRNNSSGNVTYSTSSDYRLKENVVGISSALTTVKALKPYEYKWKHDGKLGQGFFAHEAQEVLPDVGIVSGTKDEVQTEDDTKHDGQWKKDDPIYQSIDYSKLVPLLTAALQEETAKREALEARVAALEGS